jgi:hypothetical protein
MKINEKISKEGNVEEIVCEVNIFIEDANDCAVDNGHDKHYQICG